MNPIVISQQTARKFVLGKQGLWPGRRWNGKKGTTQTIRACEAVQLDPLNIIARSQDFVLHSRVLESQAKGKVPKGWNPTETTTLEDVTFLSPLDIVSARGRANKLFDFEYEWEVYTPAHQRRWGYYVLPILYGDDLAARLDLKLDRTTMTLEIKDFVTKTTLLQKISILPAGWRRG